MCKATWLDSICVLLLARFSGHCTDAVRYDTPLPSCVGLVERFPAGAIVQNCITNQQGWSNGIVCGMLLAYYCCRHDCWCWNLCVDRSRSSGSSGVSQQWARCRAMQPFNTADVSKSDASSSRYALCTSCRCLKVPHYCSGCPFQWCLLLA